MKPAPATSMLTILMLASSLAWGDPFDDTIKTFKDAGESAKFFDNSYGYAVFPTIGKAGLGVGGARYPGGVGRHRRAHGVWRADN